MGNETVKRLAILIGVVALVGGGGYALWAFQVDRMAHGVVARADRAAKEGRHDEAVRLYREHLAVVPNDVETQLKYGDELIEQDRTSRRQKEDALTIFEDVLKQYPGREDVRRRAVELSVEMGGRDPRKHLEILLRTAKGDGHLEYLMGRCLEQADEFARAAESYEAAVGHEAPERFEAAQRRATLLRDKLDKKDEADKAIDAMVASATKDYRAYLGRGRYREHFKEKGGVDDFRKAMELAPDEPEIYLELALALERTAGRDAARPYLDRGLAKAPKSAALYQALAVLEQRSGRIDEAIKALELGLKALPDDLGMSWQLAGLLAGQGEKESGRLLLQIAELRRQGVSPVFTQYLEAHHAFNKGEFRRAAQLLLPLRNDLGRSQNADMTAMVELLIGRCYGALNEPERQQEAIARARAVKGGDSTIRIHWLQSLLDKGDVDQALREFESLREQLPAGARLPLLMRLADQVIERTRRRPGAEGAWKKAEELLGDLEKERPGAIEPALLRARMLLARGQEAKARGEIETARGRHPKDPRPWTAEAELLIGQGRSDPKAFDQARALLDRAEKELGDRVEVRLARALLAGARGGPGVVPTLNELGRHLESFARADRLRLLRALAIELGRLQDLKGATDAWGRIAAEMPEDRDAKLQLFDLALRAGDDRWAEGLIREIEKGDDKWAAFCRAQLLAWRARRADDPAAREKARGEARGLLAELGGRYRDWPMVPLALARLDEEKLAEAGGDEDRRRELLDSAIASYRRAIELGQHDPAVMRNYIQLLFRAGRGAEALQFTGDPSTGGLLTGDLGRAATLLALSHRDFDQAEEIARKAVAADPEDFPARVRLAQVLLEQRRPEKAAEAAEVIRKGVDAAGGEPDRWLTLVRTLILGRRLDEAERAARDAEPHLAAAPAGLARCFAEVGKAFALAEPERARSWYARARASFDAAQRALKDPKDLSVKRQLAEFLLQADRAAAEAPLKDILAATDAERSPALATWARRGLAQIYVNASPPRTAEALDLFAGKSGRGDDPEDVRIMSMIHEAQRTVEGRRQAIADLEDLLARKAATPEDRRRLAQLLELDGQWPRASDQFRDLISLADAATDPETVNRRPFYLVLFVEALIRHHKPGDDSDLEEARRQVDRLRPTQRDPLVPLLLDVQIDRAANRPEAAFKRVRDYAGRGDVEAGVRLRLAADLERLGAVDAAEWTFRLAVDEAPRDRKGLPARVALARFYAHRGRMKEAADLCDPLWAEPANRPTLAVECITMFCDPAVPLDVAQTRRAAGWYEVAAAADPGTFLYPLGLGTILERLADYPGAEAAYRRAIRIKDPQGIAANNLAWLIALKGGPYDEALDLINAAIRAQGPMAEYLDTRGMVLLLAGRQKQALPDLQAACRAAPSAPKYFHLAQAYLRLDDKASAQKALKDGKTRGLPGGLHRLELAGYRKISGELGIP